MARSGERMVFIPNNNLMPESIEVWAMDYYKDAVVAINMEMTVLDVPSPEIEDPKDSPLTVECLFVKLLNSSWNLIHKHTFLLKTLEELKDQQCRMSNNKAELSSHMERQKKINDEMENTLKEAQERDKQLRLKIDNLTGKLNRMNDENQNLKEQLQYEESQSSHKLAWEIELGRQLKIKVENLTAKLESTKEKNNRLKGLLQLKDSQHSLALLEREKQSNLKLNNLTQEIARMKNENQEQKELMQVKDSRHFHKLELLLKQQRELELEVCNSTEELKRETKRNEMLLRQLESKQNQNSGKLKGQLENEVRNLTHKFRLKKDKIYELKELLQLKDTSNEMIIDHRRRQHRIQNVEYLCHICCKQYLSIYLFNRHMNKHSCSRRRHNPKTTVPC